MADKKENIIYSKVDINNYLQGKMKNDAMHLLERAALQDPFLADAIEGYSNADKANADKNLNEIEALILGKKQQAKIVDINNSKTQWWNIAAACVLFAGLGWVSIKLMNNEGKKPAISKVENLKPEPNTQLQLLNDSVVIDENNIATSQQKRKKEKLIFADAINLDKTDANYTISTPRESVTTVSSSSSTIGNAATNSISDSLQLNTKSNFASNYNNKFFGPSTNNASNGNYINNTNIYVKDLNKEKKQVSISSVAKLEAAKFVANNDEKVSKVLVASNTNTAVFPTTKMKHDSDYNVIPEIAFSTKRKAAKPITYMLSREDSLSVPVNGWAAFNEYLQENNKPILTYDTAYKIVAITNSKTGEDVVALEFDIDKYGNPQKIKVIKSVDEETDSKAIDLLKRGPKWQTKKQKGKLSIKF